MLQPTSELQIRKGLIEATPSGEGADHAIDLREILRILRRRRWIIILTTIGLLTGAIVFILAATPRYTGTSTILIDPHRSSVVNSDSDRSTSSNSLSDETTINSQVALIESVAVLKRVVDDLKLADDPEFGPHPGILDPIKRLFFAPFNRPFAETQAPPLSPEEVAKIAALYFLQKHRLTVTLQKKTSLVDINVSSEDPEKAAKIANAIADSYVYEQVHSRYDTQKIAASWFNKQIESLKAKVLASDRAVEEFRSTHNLTAAQGVTINDQQLSDLNNKLIEAHTQTAQARAKFQEVQNIAETKPDPSTWTLSSDVIPQLRTQYAEVARNLADVSSKYGPGHPQVVNAKAQLRAIQKVINEELKRILENTRQEFQVARSREDALQKSLDNLTQVSNESGSEQVRLRELQREASANRTLYSSFLARFKETSAQESVELPDSRVVSKADIPISPSFPKTTLILGLALAGGIGFGAVLALAVDHFDRRVKSLGQAETVTGVPALAAIPLIGSRELARRAIRGRQELSRYDPTAAQMLPPAMQPPLMRYVLEEPTSFFAESVRSVRLAVQRAARTESAKTIMVTSSVDGEGKTTLAMNLALSLATVGMRTILVEGDLRNPEMSRSLCPHASAGVIEIAAGQAGFEQALFADRTTGLTVLPSPARKPEALDSEFVFSDAMSNILGQLRQHFNYVIIDSPPLVPLVDARALAEVADGIVLTIRWNKTPRDVVTQALETIAPAYDRVLGTVLTRVDMQRLRFYDYYRSSSYLTPYSYLGQPRTGRAS
jgi:succinoglycan biosynthesis transport protein ExoP